jgi:hypothetical protein
LTPPWDPAAQRTITRSRGQPRPNSKISSRLTPPPAFQPTSSAYLAFAHEVIDRYGRFLTFLHRNDQTAKPRPYNEQLLAAGVAAPYLIWPNVAPFVHDRRVPQPDVPIGGIHLDAARNAVASARQNQLGIFAARNGLRLLPELRYLARTTNGPNPSRPGPDRVRDIPAGTGEPLPPHRLSKFRTSRTASSSTTNACRSSLSSVGEWGPDLDLRRRLDPGRQAISRRVTESVLLDKTRVAQIAVDGTQSSSIIGATPSSSRTAAAAPLTRWPSTPTVDRYLAARDGPGE